MATLQGTVVVTRLPPHRGLIVNVCFYGVDAEDAPAPFDGDPPAEAATNCEQIFKQVDLFTESKQSSYDLPFRIDRPAGFYYLQVRAILFRTQERGVFGQVEPFFFGRWPATVGAEPQEDLTLAVEWPSTPLEDLHVYGTMSPPSKRPWWRFW